MNAAWIMKSNELAANCESKLSPAWNKTSINNNYENW